MKSATLKETPLGYLPSNWEVKELGNLCEIKGRIGWRGYTIEDLRTNGPLVIGAKQISKDNKLDLSDPAYLSREKFEESPEIKIELNDIIIVKVGNTIGKVAIIKKDIGDACINPNTVLIKRSKIDPYFLFSHLVSSYGQHFLISNSSASAQPAINQATLKKLLVPVPPPNEQQFISKTLRALDDKIELNQKMNETLGAMAQAIFKSWFVDFGPVRAKAEGRKPSGMDAATAALFPDSFQDSPLGKIPKEWEVKTVVDDFNLIMGQSPPGETYNEAGKGLPFYQGRADFGSRYPARRVYCTAPTRIASPGDTLVCVRAPVGDINMVSEQCCIGRGLAAIRHKTGSRSYTYYLMHSLAGIFDRFEAGGTVFGSINKNDFQEIKVIAPPLQIIQSFEAKVFHLDQSIENNNDEAHTLKSTRDILLPKLLSGETRLKSAEKFLEGIAR